MSAAPWWTEADEAETIALVDALVNGAFRHREECSSCVAGETCAGVRAAIGELVEWHRVRGLISRAQWLRTQQDLSEAA
jgi:hypothetical protein